MRKAVRAVLLALVVGAFLQVPHQVASADSPPPPPEITVVDPLVLQPGVDASIRANGSSDPVGEGAQGDGAVIDQYIRQFDRAVSFVRVCTVRRAGRVRLDGRGGGLNWKVTYHKGTRDISRAVIAGTYRTRWLAAGACARVKVTVRLRFGGDTFEHTVRVRAIPRSGKADAVSTRVHINGPLVVP